MSKVNNNQPSIPITELEELYYQMGEDYHLWDEDEQGEYPIQRVFDAIKKFITEKKLSIDQLKEEKQ